MVLGLVDDDVAVDERRPVEDRVGLVDEQLVGGRPRPLLAARPGQQPVDELDRLLRRPRRVEHLAQRSGRGPRVVTARAAAQLLLGDRAQPQPALVERHDAVRRPLQPLGDLLGAEDDPPYADRHDDVVGRRADAEHGGELQLVEHRRVTLRPCRRGVVDAGDVDLRHAQVEHRRLAHAALAERREDVADVVEERPVRPDHEHAVAGEAAAVLEQQVRGTVQGDGGLAGAGAALDDEHLVHRRPDHEVLLGLDRRHDLAHRAGALGADLGEHGVRDAAGHVRRVRVVEVLVEVRRQLTLVEHEAPAQVHAERVGAGGAVERRGDRRPPVDDDGVVGVVLDVAAADVPRLAAGVATCRCARRSRRRPGS